VTTYPTQRSVKPGGARPEHPARARDAITLLSVDIAYEHDVVLARQRARQVAELIGFEAQDQTRIATALSELARNAYEYAGGGRVTFAIENIDDGTTRRQQLTIRISDEGPGIADIRAVLDGRYVSPTGMGLGLIGARRLSDRFHIETAQGNGTVVEVSRFLPRGAVYIDKAAVVRIADELALRAPRGAFEVMREQNQELLRTLEELRARQAEVEHLNQELAETNRGVLALYAELDDRAQDLKRASEYKSRFLSDVSHEFRTPLTSVLNMTRFLIDRADGTLSTEQERQVVIIRKTMEGLNELVNDLLDLAKIEAGHITMRPAEFTVSDLFAGLRGMFRPLVQTNDVTLVIDDPTDIGPMNTDEQRLSQVLRNFISNAIKFTPRGVIRVAAVADASGDTVRFEVRDTGIGIAPADHERIFQDFTQVDGPIQRRVRGTGLGLPLTRKLAALLGGSVALDSEVGKGSCFSLTVPRVLTPVGDAHVAGTEFE
jgi:signal transduction histidine kinase